MPDLWFILMIAIGTAGQLLFKFGVNSCSAKIGPVTSITGACQSIFIFLINPFIILALTASALCVLIYLQLLFKYDLSFIFPLFSVIYLTVLFFSWLLLGEQISLLRLTGTLIVMLGVVVISLTR